VCRPPGASALLVNGMIVDLAAFDLYAFVDTLRKEVALLRRLGYRASPILLLADRVGCGPLRICTHCNLLLMGMGRLCMQALS